MKADTVEIPMPVLSSVETLDELQDWLTAQNPKVIAELRAARREDRAGKFKPWKPRQPAMPYRVEIGSKADTRAGQSTSFSCTA
jgi:hypothetical protein